MKVTVLSDLHELCHHYLILWIRNNQRVLMGGVCRDLEKSKRQHRGDGFLISAPNNL